MWIRNILFAILTVFLFSSVATAATPTVTNTSRFDSGFNDWIYDAAIDKNGNTYVTGTVVDYTTGNIDMVTIKYAPDLSIIFQDVYNSNGTDRDEGYTMTVDSNGIAYVTGYANNLSALYRYSANGSQKWILNKPGFSIHDAAVDSLNNIYITSTDLTTYTDHYISKYNFNSTTGNFVEIWTQPIPGTNFVTASNHSWFDANNNAYIGAYTPTGIEILKYDANGSSPASILLSQLSNITEFLVEPSGTIYVIANAAYSSFEIVKIDNMGSTLWNITDTSGRCNITGNSHANLIATDASGNAFLGGRENASRGFCIIKYNGASGTEEWLNAYTRGVSEVFYDLAIDSNNNVYITGNSRNSTGSDDFLTVKYSPNGMQEWVMVYDDGTENWVPMINISSNNNIYISGYSCDYSNGENCDITTVKYSQGPATIADIIAIVNEMLADGRIIKASKANVIIQLLNNAQNNITSGNISGATGQLNSTINFIQAQSGKSIDTDAANELISYINNILLGF